MILLRMIFITPHWDGAARFALLSGRIPGQTLIRRAEFALMPSSGTRITSIAPDSSGRFFRSQMARTFLLNRSGDRGLSFRGRLIASAGEQGTQGEARERWHSIAIYHTESGRFVAAVEYHATWEGEEEWFVAYVAESPEELVERLQKHDPLSCVFGYPDTPQFKSRNDQMHRVLRTRYDNALASVLTTARKKLGGLGDDFVETI